MTLTFAHPLAALAGLAGLVPLALAVARLRVEHRVRGALGLVEPPWRTAFVRPLALVCAFVLLGLAAARPTLRVRDERTARTGVQGVVALDSSRSMLASRTAGAAERWQRARTFARQLRSELPGVPMGLSSFTNRVLPYLFPTSDPRAYDLVLDEAYGIERPPPALTIEPWVTVFDPLTEVAARRFFSPSARRRVLVVLSDAEAHPFDAAAVLRRLRRAHTTPVVVRFWHGGERIFRRGAASYRATEPDALAGLRRAGWAAFSEDELGAAAAFVRKTVGTGPRARLGVGERDTALAPFLVLGALVPLVVLVARGAPVALRRRPA